MMELEKMTKEAVKMMIEPEHLLIAEGYSVGGIKGE